MFSRFIKNKILSALVLISSLSYGGQAKNSTSDEACHQPRQQEHAQTFSSTDKIDINGMPFYIPPEEPSLEERKKKAVLMYWEHLDPKTGKISVIKYPDTLKVKEEEPTEVYDDSDLTPWPWFKQNKVVSAPKMKSEVVVQQPISTTNSVAQIKPIEKNTSEQEPLFTTNSVAQMKPVETSTSEPDSLDEILAKLEAEEKEKPEITNTTSTNKIEAVVCPSLATNTPPVSDTIVPSQTNALPQVNHACEQSIHEVEELMTLLEQESKKEDLQPNSSNKVELVQSSVSTNHVESVCPVIPISTNSIQNSVNQNSREIEELLALLEKEEVASQTNLMTQSPKVEIPQTQKTDTNIVEIISPQTDVFPMVVPQTSKSSTDEINELLKELEKEGVSSQQSSHKPQDLPVKRSGVILSALGGPALLGMSKLRKKKSEKKKTQPNLISSKRISKEQTEKRNELANKLKAIRTIEDIKRQRQLLSKQLRLARINNDEQTIQSILDTRKELIQKRRQACLCITDPYMAKIKEERRLLTKKMTIARKRKDFKTISKITQQREQLKEEVKSLNAYIREFNYTQQRASFLKQKTVKAILSHQHQR